MAEESVDELRDSARNRGLKLLRSRKRKPGVGDYGKFGLSDAAGTPVFGIEDGELTATADEVWDYLRRGLAATWKESAEAAEPITNGEAQSAPRTSTVRKPKRAHPQAPPKPPEPPKLRLVAPSPPAELVIRAAKPKDAAGLSKLLAALEGVETGETVLAKAIKRGDWALADQGGVVGCIAWTVVDLPLRAPIGRLGLLYVAEDARNGGVGRQLVAHAQAALADAGCRRVEVMSDIDIRNSHEFFRRTGFVQASYRFVREVKS